MMRPSPQMPVPEPDALAASQALLASIAARIEAAGGWIGFDEYMQRVLYAPGLGYYSGGAQKFGAAGDFVTAPGLGPLFAQTLAAQIAELITHSGPNILEFGAGGGELAGDLLAELGRRSCTIEQYAILEPSAELAERQRAAITQRAPDSVARVVWLQQLPEKFRGVMLANEVVDAMPAHLVSWHAEGAEGDEGPRGAIRERGVSFASGRLHFAERPAQGALLECASALPIAPPYISEIGLAASGWMHSVADSLDLGALLVIDYGFPAREFYHPQRAAGTLMCHYRHNAHADPFFHPGLQDITAHVDFSALAASGSAAGLDLLGYATQSNFLINCGITTVLERCDPSDVKRYAPLAASAHTLLSPAEMGELFKVLCMGRGMRSGLRGFARGDRSHTL